MLNGVKVLSFTHFLQGPSAVQILADLGAEVVKIEPTRGAWERHWSGAEAYLNGVSVFFLLSGRNQRSLGVDLRSEKGKELVWRLIRDSDVIVENYRPGGPGPPEPGHERPGGDQRSQERPTHPGRLRHRGSARGGARGSGRPRRPLRAAGHGQGETGRQQSAELGAGPADRTVHLSPQRTTIRPQRDGYLLAVSPGDIRHL